MNSSVEHKPGFTIVELLVVIVIIGILATITVVSYTGISKRATIASLQSDLTNASTQLKMHQAKTGSYPSGVDCTTIPTPADKICIKSSAGNNFTYTPAGGSNPQTFTLDAANGATVYRITNDTTPTVVAGLTCPTGFIVVPGSATYSTSDFCVMKYEAKILGDDNGNQGYNSAFVPESRLTGTPWVNISQTNTITEAQTACTGCHLITEAEWLTIAQNVLNVAANWSTGTVGSGFIYSGNNDGSSGGALDADINDSNGYYGTGNVANSNQKRTLILSNGEVIWDMAGNVWEWTAGTVQSPVVQPGVTNGYGAWREWTAITNPGTVSPNPSPAFTGISGANTWTTANGIGEIYSSTEETTPRAFIRGGHWSSNSDAGILELNLFNTPGSTATGYGFRVAK